MYSKCTTFHLPAALFRMNTPRLTPPHSTGGDRVPCMLGATFIPSNQPWPVLLPTIFRTAPIADPCLVRLLLLFCTLDGCSMYVLVSAGPVFAFSVAFTFQTVSDCSTPRVWNREAGTGRSGLMNLVHCILDETGVGRHYKALLGARAES